MDILNYIRPELLVVALACYFIGSALKNTTIIKDKWIPLTLGIIATLLSVMWQPPPTSSTGNLLF